MRWYLWKCHPYIHNFKERNRRQSQGLQMNAVEELFLPIKMTFKEAQTLLNLFNENL